MVTTLSHKKKNASPITNGKNGRKKNGRFAPGNTASVGHSTRHAQRRLEFQRFLLNCVTEDDLREIADKLVEKAKTGDMYAIKELFDRVLGKPTAPVDLEVSTGLQDFIDSLLESDN